MEIAYLYDFIAVVFESFVLESVFVELDCVANRLFPGCWSPIQLLFRLKMWTTFFGPLVQLSLNKQVIRLYHHRPTSQIDVLGS